MNSESLILSIDQGTTSSRAILFDSSMAIVSSAQQEFSQHYPDDGWVEHDPGDIWRTTLDTCRETIAGASGNIAGVGITNQRETTLVWDRQSGEPVYNAIVWQDRRTAEYCDQLKQSGLEQQVIDKTGLLLDPYFSATKIRWILENVEGARKRAENGALLFGTVDCWLIWKLTGGHQHLTDATNASRTMLFNIHDNRWDPELLSLFEIPESMLPEVRDCAADFGVTDSAVLDLELPIAGVAGDQQAALFGQGCFEPGMVKSTYGTGCFLVMNTGTEAIRSNNKLLSTVGYRINGKTSYALEGSIFNAGTAVQWLRDGIGIIDSTAEIDGLLDALDTNQGVYLVPAFTGMGAPHWRPDARGILNGITRDTDRSHLVRAAIESVCYQTRDLVAAMLDDSGLHLAEIRVDGGMVVNDRLLQFLSDITDTRICRPTVVETTALGAAYLARLQLGLIDSLEDISGGWQQDAVFDPTMDDATRRGNINGWEQALAKCLG